MADLKIVISADPNNALTGLEKTRDSIEATGRTIGEVLNSSARAFRNFSEAESRSADDATDAGKAINNYNDKLKLIKDSYTHAIASANDYRTKMSLLRKELTFFSKEYQEALLQGKFTQGSNKDGMANQLEADMDKVRNEMKILEADKAKTANINNEIRRKAEAEQLQLIGTRYEQLTAEIEKHKKTLSTLLIAKNRQKDVTEKLKARIDKEVQSIKNLTKEQQKAAKVGFFEKMLSVAKNIMGFQMAIMLFRKTTTSIVNTLKDSVKVATEAEQVYSKLGTVFDGVATSMEKTKEVAIQLGVANSTAASALSTIGDQLQAQGMGATESLQTAARWAKQFQDIIAFKDINMSLEEFAQNFMSGAAGNLRNFRTFGSVVKESSVQAELARKGLDKLTGSQLELAKMTTRAEMALSQQANAMGATEREWDTALSVSRRLNEAWKEYKENLGDTLLNYVKPIKKEIYDILNEANKENRARRGERVYTGVNDIYSVDYDYLLKETRRAYSTFSKEVSRGSSEAGNNLKTAIERIMSGFDVLPDEKTLNELFDSLRVREGDRSIISNIIDSIEETKTLEEQMKAYADTVAIANDNLDTLRETLEAITGVQGVRTFVVRESTEPEKLDIAVRGAENGMIADAVASMLGTGWRDFADSNQLVFNEAQETANAYKEWGDAVIALRAIIEKTDPGSKYLQSLEELYGRISFESATTDFFSASDSWRMKTYDLNMGFSDRDKAIAEADLAYVKLKKSLIGLTEEQDALLKEELKAQKKSINAYYDSVEAKEKEKKASDEAAEAQKRLAEALSDMQGTIRGDIFGSFGSLGNLGQVLFENIDFDNFKESAKKIFSGLWKGIKSAFGSEENFSKEEGSKVKDLWSAIWAVVQELDIFDTFMEGVSIGLEALNSILAPFIPFIEYMNEITRQLLQLLSPLIPVMKMFASVLTIVSGVINVAINMILAAFGDIAGGVVGLVADLMKGIKKVLGIIKLPTKIKISWSGISIKWKSLSDLLGLDKAVSGLENAEDYLKGLGSYDSSDALDQMNDTLDKIWATSNEIAANTEKDDLSDVLAELNELYANGIIDANTYNARVNKLTGTRSLDMVNSRGIWNNGFSAGTRTNYMNVTINGSGLSASELESTLVNVLTKISNGTVSVQTQLGSFA